MLISIHNADSLIPADVANLNCICVDGVGLVPAFIKVVPVFFLGTVGMYCQIRKIRTSCRYCYYYCYC